MGKKINLSYIAGFFDGDGCVSLSNKGLRVILTNCDRKTLGDVFDFFKVRGKINSKLRTKKDIYVKKCYQLVYWNKQAEIILKELLPYLRQKKSQARLALKFQKTYLVEHRGRGKKLSLDIIEKRKSLIEQVKEAKWVI